MKNLIYGTALMMIMALSANSFASPKSFNGYGEKSKMEKRGDYGKKDDMKKGQGKQGSCHHHHKNGCHKK